MVRLSLLVASLLLVCAASASATSVPYSFHCVSGDGGGECAIPYDQLSLDVTDEGGGEVSFKITNHDGDSSFVLGVYLEDSAGALDELVAVVDGSGVDFEAGGSPGSLPSGVVESFDADWAITARAPKNSNGAGPGEDVTIVFSLASGWTFDDLIGAIDSGELRVGVFAPGFDDRGNKSFLTSARAVPEPGPLALLLAALGVVALRRR